LAASGLVGEVGLVAGLVFRRQRRLLRRPPTPARIKNVGATSRLHRRAGVWPASPLAREIGVFGLVECGSHGDGRQQHRRSDRDSLEHRRPPCDRLSVSATRRSDTGVCPVSKHAKTMYHTSSIAVLGGVSKISTRTGA